MRATHRKMPHRLIAVLAAGMLVLVACGDGDDAVDDTPADEPEESEEPEETDEPEEAEEAEEAAADWPDDDLMIIVPSNEGGGMDTTGRRLQAGLDNYFDNVNVGLENHGGGGTTIGTNFFLNTLDGVDECYAMLETNNPILFIAPGLFEGVEWSHEEMRPIGIPASNPGVWAVADDAPWDTFEELIEDAVANPGEIRVSTSSASLNNHAIAIFEIEEQTGAEFNVIPFDGGGSAREALTRGEVEVTHVGAYNRLGIADDTRVLAVQEPENNWPDITDDAPTVNEILGTDLGTSGSYYGWYVSNECYENYPERFDILAEAYNAAVWSDEYQADLEAVDEGGTVVDITPEEMYEQTQTDAQTAQQQLEEYGDRFTE